MSNHTTTPVHACTLVVTCHSHWRFFRNKFYSFGGSCVKYNQFSFGFVCDL